jgi:glucan 1,3-beta-glucosidase
MRHIRGVNLGGWLVLEKWMTPELFEGTTAKDEYHLLKQREPDKSWLTKHRDTFITKEDFVWIKQYGLNTVRLPIGHWALTASAPYLECAKYIDNAFSWANELGLDVVLDVHAAPGCQNGFDNGGLSGVCEWHKDPRNIAQTESFIEALCIRYKDEPSLAGIQVLNEPRWDLPLELIQSFYDRSYQIIRSYLKDDQYIVFHDAFRLDEWEEFFAQNDYKNVILDTHMYQVFSHRDKERTIPELLHKVGIQRTEELKPIEEYVDVVVGEWSLGIHPNVLQESANSYMTEALYRAVGNSLLVTFETITGWFFWNYKLSDLSTQKHPGWSFVDVVQKGYLPEQIKGVKE